MKAKLTNEQALQYSNLVHKLTNQLSKSSPFSYEDIEGYAWEGLCMAFNTYKENSTQTFLQYAAYQIKYNIWNKGNTEGSAVTLSAYHQRKLKDSNVSTYIMKHIETKVDKNGDARFNIKEPSVNPYINKEEIYNELYSYLDKKFSKRELSIFYKTMGLKNYEVTKGCILAKSYNVSNASITLNNKKIISYIRQNEELLDLLRDLY
jgi:hypothetical protein